MRIPQIWPAVFGWAFAASAIAAGQPYKCVGSDGKIVYTDQKCTANAKPVRIWDSNLGGAVSDAGAAPGVPGAPANDQQAAILRRCASQWPDDSRMQDYCTDQQREAARAMKSVVKEDADDETKLIVGTCAMQWKQGDTYDFRMMKYCYDQQSDARQRLGK